MNVQFVSKFTRNDKGLNTLRRRELCYHGVKRKTLATKASGQGADSGSVKAKTPLLAALRLHSKRETLPFHIPGHKQQPGAMPDLFGCMGENILQYDLTELPGTLHVSALDAHFR